MSEVHRLGGESCAYFRRGRCTRTTSPTAQASARCGLMEERRKVGNHTLDRLERLNKLEDECDREVARRFVINKNLRAINQLSCPGFVAASRGGPLCEHQHLAYCLLLMPECPGRCDNYLLRNKLEDAGPEGEAAG